MYLNNMPHVVHTSYIKFAMLADLSLGRCHQQPRRWSESHRSSGVVSIESWGGPGRLCRWHRQHTETCRLEPEQTEITIKQAMWKAHVLDW